MADSSTHAGGEINGRRCTHLVRGPRGLLRDGYNRAVVWLCNVPHLIGHRPSAVLGASEMRIERHFKTSLILYFDGQRTQAVPSSSKARKPDRFCHFVMQRPPQGLLSCGDGKHAGTLMAISLLTIGPRCHMSQDLATATFNPALYAEISELLPVTRMCKLRPS